MDRWRKLACAGMVMSASLLALAPLFLADSYSVLAHTTSESAAQGVPWAWIARSGLALFGMSAILMAVGPTPRWRPLARWCFALFGLFLTLSAVASSRSWIEDAPFDQLEDAVHSFAATGMGFAFAAGVLATALDRTVSSRAKLLPVHIVALSASVAIPLAMTAVPEIAGLLQRGMFLIAYAWFFSQLTLRMQQQTDAGTDLSVPWNG